MVLGAAGLEHGFYGIEGLFVPWVDPCLSLPGALFWRPVSRIWHLSVLFLSFSIVRSGIW